MRERHRDFLRELLTDGLGGRRFLQPSPVLPDVWLAFGEAPHEPQELLITPDRNAEAEQVAAKLRRAVQTLRGPEDGLRRHPAKTVRVSPAIASLPELVAARLYFDELVALVLTRTGWFARIVEHSNAAFVPQDPATGAANANERVDDAEPSQMFAALADGIEVLRHPPKGGPAPGERSGPFDPQLVWLAAVVGTVCTGGGTPRAADDTSSQAFADAFFAVFGPNPLQSLSRSAEADVFRVSLNREVKAANLETALAIKADAARRLFNISCSKITWAVVDSGIDQSHPAFRDWSDPHKSDAHRIDKTYDFTATRDLLDPATAARMLRTPGEELQPAEREFVRRLMHNLAAAGVDDPNRAGPRHVRQLQDRLEMGLQIDWGLIEPFLRVREPKRPPNSHGTQVAGILGADWREETAEANGANGGPGVNGNPAPHPPTKSVMEGVCPDIRLIDIRILGETGTVREFDVIAALQFIAYLNRRADGQVVHGANLSLEIEHNVTNYACGSTPICEACNALFADGVVLVAAAGNKGHQRYSLAGGGELGGYHAISITDPGNADGVITVGATHREAHRYGVSYFSSRGPTGDGRRKPDLVAPGEGVRGPALGHAETTSNGTSFAAPHASGAAALLMARFSELRGKPQRIKEILCSTATDLGRESYFQGAGMLDILRALQSI